MLLAVFSHLIILYLSCLPRVCYPVDTERYQNEIELHSSKCAVLEFGLISGKPFLVQE